MESITPQAYASLAPSLGWDSWWEAQTVTSNADDDRRRMMPTTRRRDSASSVSSTTSTRTPPTARGYSGCSWSTATTPDCASPTSPPDALLTQLHPERTSSRIDYSATAMASPSRAPSNRTPCAGHAGSQSMSARLHHASLEEPSNSKLTSDTSLPFPASQEALDSALHQRRQQRQQKLATYSPFPQPAKTKLAPPPVLPTQPPQMCLPRRPLNKDATRSLPQLRGIVVPLSSDSLPPLPLVPKLSPMFPASPTNPVPKGSFVPAPPAPAIAHNVPPRPIMPPPPPPPLQRTVTAPPKSMDKAQNMPDSTSLRRDVPPSQPDNKRWEDELRRHKQLLRQFPPQPEQQQGERLKMSRTYKSLGNLRARSRAHSTPSACDTSAVTFAYNNRPKASKHTKSKSLWENPGRLDDPLPPLPQSEAPHVSVFEDDSDDEGDTVRQFVRNLFTRRTRLIETTTLGSGNQDSLAANKAANNSSHSNKRKNHSPSSSLSASTTISAIVASNTAQAASDPVSSSDNGSNADGECDSPRASVDHSRPRGPLLTRMFVRRSH